MRVVNNSVVCNGEATTNDVFLLERCTKLIHREKEKREDVRGRAMEKRQETK